MKRAPPMMPVDTTLLAALAAAGGLSACLCAAGWPTPEPEREPEPHLQMQPERLQQRPPLGCGVRQEMQRRGWVQLRGALEPSVVKALCDELSEELLDPSVPPESGTPRVTLSDAATWPAGGARRVIEAVPTRATGSGGTSAAWQSVVANPALAAALNVLLGEGCWELPLNQPYEGGVIGREYVRHWYAPVMFPEEFKEGGPEGEEAAGAKRPQRSSAGSNARAVAAAPLGDASSWRTNEGEDWTAEQDETLLRARFPAAAGRPGEQAGEQQQKQQKPVSWKQVAAAVGGGRSAKQCRERWGGLKPWTAEEDGQLLALYDERGPAWSAIVQQSGLQDRSKRHVRVRAAALLREREAAAAAAQQFEPSVDAELAAAAAERRQNDRAASEWEAVNRRRVRGKGWHVDIGETTAATIRQPLDLFNC
jgi:hypothetical protein